MKRSVNSRSSHGTEPAIGVAFILMALMLASCGGASSGDPNSGPSQAQGMLRLVRSAAELELSLKAGLKSVPAGALSTTPDAPFSGTYTQEANVDEFDAVRYDGAYLYIAPQRVVTCCFLLGAPMPNNEPPPSKPRAIRILRTNPVDGTAEQVGAIPLEDGVSVQGLYLTPGRAVALTSEAYFGTYGQFWTGVPFWAPTDFGIRVYDVSEPANPRTLFTATMNGVFAESRRIGDRVYIVSRYTPAVLLDPALRDSIDTVPLEALLPKATINGTTRSLVDPAKCYVTNDDGSSGQAVITSITVIPIQDPGAFSTTCYNEDAYGVYVSEHALYLTQYRPAASTQGTLTRIHKFELSATAPIYRGSADIEGAVWTGGQADFRLSEYNGLLRVMTTDFSSDPTDNVDHRLYILRQSSTAPELEVVSRLPNERRPEEIGHANESLYGVRFFGDRAFAVSFRRIDPLYVIDLANVEDPRIAGTLELPGFSDFLHPVSADLLLGLGEAATGGVRIALFDVSTLATPRELGGVTLGGRGSWSEARYDRHAFTYLADINGVDRFAIPADLTAEDGSFRLVESALHLFEIHNKETPALATLHATGSIPPKGPDPQTLAPPAGRNRAFIHGDAVYYIRDEEVWAALWGSPSSVNGPF
jgi:hypothetical protein